MERIRALIMLPRAPLACLLLLLLSGVLGGLVLSICPSVCSCSRGHRVVDCSSRHLSQLPPGLQHNIRFLNLSHNSLCGLDGQLSHYAHLRTLDLSYNLLGRFPSGLPRALWDIRAAGNQLRALDKNDTAYHWNLQVLDLSANELERVVFINNTLPSLHALNLSHNRFWTVPTNMPHNLEMVDLSHNYLVQILLGSLNRLPRLRRFYLHANRFSWVPEGVFDRLEGLEFLTLGDNPWACEEEENITKLLLWAEHTRAAVLGCPCYTKPTCGQSHLATPGGEWHFASYTEPPLMPESWAVGASHRLGLQSSLLGTWLSLCCWSLGRMETGVQPTARGTRTGLCSPPPPRTASPHAQAQWGTRAPPPRSPTQEARGAEATDSTHRSFIL
ncbi:oligodendrocyte-myelin glycoprotein [Coregonus clupeaformis]|uniref:oligodendrocyte-myelin glycoprotein n=1 Tax=Coregonus clupeaformis TaxID=59861 RepID=UPI001E1C934A|nr:oligodendrocyte-myelin glycoprotein [Coregonus clupeaformis]